MKNYPRIYSLSTLGLIHHYENDYLFHNMRTDFVGDSGSGKSIIADLLQLIFVGSEMFESATRTMDEKRELDGLVLRTPHKGIDIGYAFLNIEIQSRHYIVIGCYLKATANAPNLSSYREAAIPRPICCPSASLCKPKILNGKAIFALWMIC